MTSPLFNGGGGRNMKVRGQKLMMHIKAPSEYRAYKKLKRAKFKSHFFAMSGCKINPKFQCHPIRKVFFEIWIIF